MDKQTVDSRYSHTQTAPLHWILWALVVFQLLLMMLFRDHPMALAIFATACSLFAILAGSFRNLSVKDRGDYLEVALGPFPLFGRRVAYDAIQRAEIGRSSLLDGWGIHYLPGRGWTYNLWGSIASACKCEVSGCESVPMTPPAS